MIEQEHAELKSIFDKLPFKTKINIFRTFTRNGMEQGDSIFQIEPLTKSTIKISTPTSHKIVEQVEEVRMIERRKGRGDLNGLTDYVIPAVKMIRSGTKHSQVFLELAKKLNVAPQTVSAQCTRSLHISTDEFVQLINSEKISDFLKNKFPYRKEVIEQELSITTSIIQNPTLYYRQYLKCGLNLLCWHRCR